MRRIAGFDGLRALSVIAVVLTHLGIYDYLLRDGWLGNRTIAMVVGWTGVQVFFVLSGFLITALLVHEHAASQTVSLRNFFLRRALRILPLYFLVLSLMLIAHLTLWPIITARALAVAATFCSNLVPAHWSTLILVHTWSIAVEEHFYLVWPLALTLLLAFNWQKAVRYLLLFSVLGVGLCAVVLLFDSIKYRYHVERWSFFAGVHLALGCAAAILILTEPFREKARSFLASPLALVLALAAFSHGILTNKGFYPREWTSPLGDFARSVGIALFVSWIFVNQKSIVVRLLETAPLRYVGKISYGVYIWQAFFLSVNPVRSAGQLWPPEPLVGLACLAVVAPLSFHFFEQPIMAMGKRFRAPYRRTPDAVAAE